MNNKKNNKKKDINPCNNNLYSSFVKSEHGCDSLGYFYYTCESFEEMDVFLNACSKREKGAKVDAPKVLANGHSRYKIWKEKVMKNRADGKGREIMYDDEQVEPGIGMSVGEGQAGKNAPITDEELGNKVDKYDYIVDKGVGTGGAHILDQQDNNIDDIYDDDAIYDDIDEVIDDDDDRDSEINDDVDREGDDGYYNGDLGGRDYEEYYEPNYRNEEILDGYNYENGGEIVDNNNHDMLEMMIMGLWGIVLSVLFICFCCVIAGMIGLLIRKFRIKWKIENEKKLKERMIDDMRFVEISDDDISDILNDNEERNIINNNRDNDNKQNERLYEDSIA